MSKPIARDPQACSTGLTRAFGFLGKRWNGLVLATLAQEPHGFAGLKRAVGGISDSMLADRLAELAEAGLVERTVEPGPPVAVNYALTTAGAALIPVLDALTAWAEEHLAE